MLFRISKSDMVYAQVVLFLAIGLQLFTWSISGGLTYGFHPLIIVSEVILAVLIGLGTHTSKHPGKSLYRVSSFILLGLISVENISSLIIVAKLLITQSNIVTGYELLAAALAIFLTNIIVFALWYWEIDSPGLSGHKWSKNDRDLLFTQQELSKEFPDWQPKFTDYLYVSVTNAINFAPADTKPLTRQAKALMGTQALVSVFTLALVLARSVSILGQ